MALTVVGISHRSAPLAIRERVAFRAAELVETLDGLRVHAPFAEAVLLSTCSRTELYVVERDDDLVPAVWTFLGARLGEDATQHGYVRRDRDAVSHLFNVAAGLDSMIVGEAQIQGQVRDAWTLCRPRSGVVLNRLFQSALQVAGRVRSETGIARGAASVSSAALQLARQIFGSLAGKRAMVLGAGEMAELALECFVNEGVRAAIVANRTHERARELAARYGADAMRFDACWEALAEVDVLLCSTASPRPVVTPARVAPALERRRGRPLCILDIALPRDVDPSVRALEHVFLYDLDDLRAVVTANVDRRRAETPVADRLIETEVERFWQWLAGLSSVPVVAGLRGAMDAMRERELAAALRRLHHLSPEDRATVEHLSRALMNKFLHEPTVRLRAAAANGRGLGVVDVVRYLFALREDDPPHVDDAAVDASSTTSSTLSDINGGEDAWQESW